MLIITINALLLYYMNNAIYRNDHVSTSLFEILNSLIKIIQGFIH